MVNKCVLHMFYLNKKTTDIVIAHVVVQLFVMPLFCIMSTLKYPRMIMVSSKCKWCDAFENTFIMLAMLHAKQHRN
jgi:hypothetical protein